MRIIVANSIRLLLGIACLLGPSAAGAGDPAPASTPWTVSLTGFGPVKFGMTVREAAAAMKLKLEEDHASKRCHVAMNDSELSGISFMVVEGLIVRVDVSNITNRTAGGAGVGMTEEWVKKLHPELKVDRHPYEAGGHLLSLTSSNEQYALIFETDGKAVTSFRAGKRDIGAPEDCR